MVLIILCIERKIKLENELEVFDLNFVCFLNSDRYTDLVSH